MPDYNEPFIDDTTPPEESIIPATPPSSPPVDDFLNIPTDFDTTSTIPSFEPIQMPTSEYGSLRITIDDGNTTYAGLRVEDAIDRGIADATILQVVQEQYMKQAKQLTFEAITVYMPEWRQIKWRNYMSIYEKEQRGETLTSVEIAIVNQMCESDSPTQADKDAAYNNCQTAMGWINDCILQCDTKEAEIAAVTVITDFKTFVVDNMTFPTWPL